MTGISPLVSVIMGDIFTENSSHSVIYDLIGVLEKTKDEHEVLGAGWFFRSETCGFCTNKSPILACRTNNCAIIGVQSYKPRVCVSKRYEIRATPPGVCDINTLKKTVWLSSA